MATFFGNIIKNILQEYSDGATNHKAQISYVDDDPKKGFYIYHACHAKDMQSIITAGARRVFVASNVCCSYGNGLYATYTLDSAKLNSTRRGSNSDGFLYGANIVKGVCRNSLRSFAIFDPNVCEKVYGHKVSITDQLQMICSKDNEGKETFKMLSSLYYFKDLNNYYGFGHTAQGAYKLNSMLEDLESSKFYPRKYIKGLIFSGGNDGNVVVMYDMSSVEIVAYTTDRGNTFHSIDREEWEHKQLSHDYDLQNELGRMYDEYPTQGFTNGYAVAGKRINGYMKYRILSKDLFEKTKDNGGDGRISDIFFDSINGLSFSADGVLDVVYDGTPYVIKRNRAGVYKIFDSEEGVYLCDLKNLDEFHKKSKNPTPRVKASKIADTTDWENIDLSGF